MTGWLPESLLHDVGSWAASQHRSRVATPRTASEWPSMEWTAPARQCSPINSLRSCATAGATSCESRSTPSTTLGPCATGEGALLLRLLARQLRPAHSAQAGSATARSGRQPSLPDGRARPGHRPAGGTARAGRASRGGPRLGRALPAPRRAPRYLGPVDLSAGAIRCLGCAHGCQGRWLRRSGAFEPDALRAGQGLYFAACSPWTCADVVVDNTNLDAPAVLA